MSDASWTRRDILKIVPGPTYRQADGQSVMPKTFGQTLSPTDLDDLVAFLLTHR